MAEINDCLTPVSVNTAVAALRPQPLHSSRKNERAVDSITPMAVAISLQEGGLPYAYTGAYTPE